MEHADVDKLMRRSDAIGGAAAAVADAAQQLSWTVHGTTSAAIPPGTAYGLLFHIKLLLHYTASITEYLPTGLHSSLEEAGCYVSDLSRKAQRNLTTQIDSAAKELKSLTDALNVAIRHIEAVQALVDYQDVDGQSG